MLTVVNGKWEVGGVAFWRARAKILDFRGLSLSGPSRAFPYICLVYGFTPSPKPLTAPAFIQAASLSHHFWPTADGGRRHAKSICYDDAEPCDAYDAMHHVVMV